jgi:hypothetical protein
MIDRKHNLPISKQAEALKSAMAASTIAINVRATETHQQPLCTTLALFEAVSLAVP